MKPRTYMAPKPLSQQPNPRKSPQNVALEKAQRYHTERQGKTQRQILIEKGIITPRKRR